MSDHTFRINKVNYHMHITGAGLPLVLLHGFTGSTESWASHRPSFAAHYETISIDLLGHGQTDAPKDPKRYDMAHAAADVIGLLDANGWEQVHLLGYSMGGRLALHIAAHYTSRL
ncbi:MAG: alpha/beta fold hydrolase, partial [Chloroflexota bacterium]